MKHSLKAIVIIALLMVTALLIFLRCAIINGERTVIANDVCLEENYGYKSCFDGKSYYYFSNNDIFKDEALISTVGTPSDRLENVAASNDDIYVNINNEIYTVDAEGGQYRLYMTDAIFLCADSNYIFIAQKSGERYELFKIRKDDMTKTNISAQRSSENDNNAVEVICDEYTYVFINDVLNNPNREYAGYKSGISMIIDPYGQVIFTDKDCAIWENLVLGIYENIAVLSDATRSQLYLYDISDNRLITTYSLSDKCTYKTGSARIENGNLYLAAEKYEFMKRDNLNHKYDVILKFNIDDENIQEYVVYKTKQYIVGYSANIVWLFDGKRNLTKYNYVEGQKLKREKLWHLGEKVYFEACNDRVFAWSGNFSENMRFLKAV